MMQLGESDGVPSTEKDPSRLDILAGKAATEGATYLLDYNKILNEIDDSIIFVDKSFKDLVNTMGRGENYAAGFGKVLEATAKDIILAGGKREDAIKIQTETINVMGRASMLSQKQAVDLFNASKVTGVASKDLTTAFLDSGRNLSNISKEMLVVRETAQSLGVNAKQVSSLVTSNLDKLNRFTFRGGVEGLARMAANAQSMRVGMESTFDLVDELMNPEKAIEMASEFQRMGIASADLTNPLKLMSMEAGELQEKIAEAMSKYVTIGEDGTKTISQQGVRVMKQLASQGVLTRGELEKLAIGTREMQDKMSKISFAGLNLDEDTQKLIANVAQLGEGGTYEIQTTDENNKIVSKSIEQFVQDLGGDQEKIRQALLSQEQKTGDASKDMGAIAQGQLDALTTMTQQNALLLASLGFTVSAGKMGPELLKASVELNKFINTPILKNIGSESDLGKGIDNTAVEIKNALEEFKSGKIDTNSLMKLLQDFGGVGGKLAGQFGETGMEIVKDYAEELGIGEDVVVNIIQGIKEGLPEVKEQGVKLLYTILDGINMALEEMGIEVPDEFKKKKKEEKETGTGGTEKPKPPVLGSDKTTETPSPTPTETEKPKPPVLGSNITPGTGGDEGLLFLEDLQNLDLQQLASQLIQPLEKLDVGTSEVGTLNVQNLVIGGGLEKIITQNESEGFTPQTPEPTPTIQPTNTETTKTEEIGLLNELKVDTVNVQNLVIGSGLEKTITPKEGEPLINQEQVESVVKPTVTPTLVQPIPQEELPIIPETTEELPSLKKVVEEPKEDKKGFFEKVNNFVQELKTEPVKENLNVNEVLKPAPTTEPSEITKTFEKSLDNISKLKMPELGIFKKEEQKPSDLVKGFEDSAKKMADLKIGGLEEKSKIELGKPEGKTEEGLFDKKPSILGKFISKKQSETEEEPKEEKKGKFSKIKDAFVKSFIEPKEEEQTFTLPEEEYTPSEIGTEEGLTNIDKTATELGTKQEESTNISTQEIQPETELKINTSEVENLNVKNLNIGPELIKLLGTTKEVKEGESVDVQIQKLIDEGLVGEPMASTGNEVVFKSNTQESLDVEGISQTSPLELNPEVTPTQVPNIDIESGLPEFTDELPSVQKGKQKTRGGFTKTKPSFSEMEYGSKAPSQYESFKKVLEESYGGEIIGTGAEAFVRTPEMIAEAKKNAEFIGEYEPSGITPKKEEDKDIIKLRKEMEDEAALKEKEDSYYNNLSELYKEISNIEKKGPIEGDNEKILKSLNDRVNKTIADIENLSEEETPKDKIESIGLIEDKGLAPIKPTLASLPIPETEEKQPLGKRLKEGIGGIKEKGKGLVGEIKEKIKGEKPEEKPISAVPETQEEYVVKDKDGNIIGTSIDERAAKLKGESKTKSTESMGGFTVEKQTVTPTVPETPLVGVEQVASEVKEPKTLRERIEGGADKLSSGIEKFAGKIGKKFEGSKLKTKIDEIKGELKPQEEPSKIEPIKEDMFPLSKGFEGSFTEVKDGKLVIRDPYEMLDEKNKKEKDKIGPISESEYREGLEEIYGKEAISELSPMSEPPESGYLKMLKENDEKATPFLTSKSGKPVNLDETEKIGLKGIEGFGKKEKSSSFGLDMKMFEQKLPEVPKASLEKTKTDNIDFKSIEDSVPKVEDTRSALEKVSLTASEDEGFESGLIEPAEVFPTENETRQNKEEEERKDRSFAYLEELRLREQTPTVPETPAKGIEKIAQLGQKFEGKIGGLKEKLFGKKEEEESSLAYYEPEISTEEPYISEGIEEASTEDYGTLAEETESEVTPPQAIEEAVPSVPEPATSQFGQLQDMMGQGGGEQATAQGETTQNINIHATIEIVGNAEFAKLIDPRQLQQKIESIMTTSIGKPQIAQKFNSATSTEAASMGVKDTNRRRY